MNQASYDDLFSISKQEDESLQSLMNRVDTAIHRIQDLRPKDFTLSNLDDELARGLYTPPPIPYGLHGLHGLLSVHGLL